MKTQTLVATADERHRAAISQINWVGAAYRAALAGEYERASSLLGKVEPQITELPRGLRIDAAAALQLLSRPTAALNWLPTNSANASLRFPSQVDEQWLRLRLLLDAGRLAEAKPWADQVSDDATTIRSTADGNPSGSPSVARRLVLAEYRHMIGWRQGARDLLDELVGRLYGNSDARVAEQLYVPATQRAELELLRAIVMRDDEPLKAMAAQTSDSPVLLALRGKSLIAIGRRMATGNNYSSAIEHYEKVVRVFEARLPNHTIAIQAMHALVGIAQQHDDDETFKKWRDHAWNCIVASREFGTSHALWCACHRMRSATKGSSESRQDILDCLRPYANVYQADPYLDRQILTFEAKVAMTQTEWHRAALSLSRLRRIEKTLWADTSLEYALATATHAHVLAQYGRSDEAEQARSLAISIVRTLQESEPKKPVLAFLAVVTNRRDEGRPIYEWIEQYRLHRFNSPSEQRKMIDYVSTQIRDEFPGDAKLLADHLAE